MTVPVRLVLVDDQALVRAGFRMVLDAQPDMEVVGESGDGAAALDLLSTTRADIVLMDIRMPRMDGVAATEALCQRPDPPRVIVLTTFDLDEYAHAALRAGASGFLLKDAGPELLAQAIRAAAGGDALIAPKITVRLLEAFARSAPAASPAQPIEPLTEREEQVLAKVANGMSNTEIAGELYITLSTVKTHVASLMAKLHARNRVEIAIWAHETRRR